MSIEHDISNTALVHEAEIRVGCDTCPKAKDYSINGYFVGMACVRMLQATGVPYRVEQKIEFLGDGEMILDTKAVTKFDPYSDQCKETCPNPTAVEVAALTLNSDLARQTRIPDVEILEIKTN